MAYYTFSGCSGEGRIALPSPKIVTVVDWNIVTPGHRTDFLSVLHPRRVMHAGWIAGTYFQASNGTYATSFWFYLEHETGTRWLHGDPYAYAEYVHFVLDATEAVDIFFEY